MRKYLVIKCNEFKKLRILKTNHDFIKVKIILEFLK